MSALSMLLDELQGRDAALPVLATEKERSATVTRSGGKVELSNRNVAASSLSLFTCQQISCCLDSPLTCHHTISPAVMSEPKDLLLLVWVHGFKGNDVTFESFPDRLTHLLKSTHPSLRVESSVFPAYQTRGELHAATLAFVDWLTELVVKLECNHGEGGGAGKARVVLMGHSMGGLLIADAVRDIAKNTREGDPMWPHIVGVLAFDTPYLGLHPHTFKHGLSTAAGYYEQARNIASAATMLSPLAVGWGASKWGFGSGSASTSASSSSNTPPGPSSQVKGKSAAPDSATNGSEAKQGKSSWSIPTISAPSAKSLYGLGAVALGAAAVGTAYYRREDFFNGWKWGYEHMTFVRNLWDDEGLKDRLDDLDRLSREKDVLFANYYTHLPPTPPEFLVTRTFCILPPVTHPLYPKFVAASNTLAKDEVSAHMGMFNAKTNDGFYELGLVVVGAIGERIEREGVGRVEVVGDDGTGPKASDGWREEKQGEEVVWVEQ